MKKRLEGLTLIALVASVGLAHSEDSRAYVLHAPYWWCANGRATLDDVDKLRPDYEPPETVRRMKESRCLSFVGVPDYPVSVIAFQGRYAFICDKQRPPMDPEKSPSFFCYYTLTKYLRDRDGKAVSNHFSKTSPSPHFFDN